MKMPSPARTDLHKALYVPAASISLGAASQDLLRTHGLAFTSVQVDLQLSMAGTFKFTVPNTFDVGRAEFLTARGERALNLLKLGERVWIRMGYGDQSGQQYLLSGYITNIGTSFAEGSSPDLEVSGQDSLYRLTLGTHEHRFEAKSVQDAVGQVARDNGFSLRFGGTPPAGVTLDANMQSDLAFVGKLAANFSTPKAKWEFFSRVDKSGGDKLYFRPRSVGDAPVGTLKWGADLLSFRPEAGLGDQVSRVVVKGWDEVGKAEIIGEARAQVSAGGKTKTAGQIQQSFLSSEAVRTFRYPVKSKKEADERAAAELATIIVDHLKGEGETFGFPELLPDTRVKLEGLGAKFSRTYYVTKTVHTYDSSGYRTRFSIEEQDS
jgi:phage protein D